MLTGLYEIARGERNMAVKLQLEELLEERGHTLYWLAKESGVDYQGLYRFKTGKAHGIRFNALEGICKALECSPGDLLVIEDDKPETKRKSKSKG
jgi:putative transcriptional regulator